jgi:hypothetical protein
LTKDLNLVLARAEKKKPHPHSGLAILKTDRGLVLAWVYHAISPYDDQGVADFVGLKQTKQSEFFSLPTAQTEKGKQTPTVKPVRSYFIYFPPGGLPRAYCFRSPDDLCHGPELAAPTNLTPSHDATLSQCTKDINAHLSGTSKSVRDHDREMAILETSQGLLLAWIATAARQTGSNGDTLDKVLGFS